MSFSNVQSGSSSLPLHAHKSPTISSDPDLETAWEQTETLQNLVKSVKEGNLDANLLLSRLQKAGASSSEAKDYSDEIKEFFEFCHYERGKQPQQGDQSSDQSTHIPPTNTSSEISSQQAADAIIWRQLQEKLDNISAEHRVPFSGTSVTLEDLSKIFQFAKPQLATIPSEVLAEAPHLGELLKSTMTDEHLESTWHLRQVYSTEKVPNAIIDLMQHVPMNDPIPRSIWKDIILDKFVNFEKLYASFGWGYEQDDEPKNLIGGFAIIKKDYFQAKKLVSTEVEWFWIARAWTSSSIGKKNSENISKLLKNSFVPLHPLHLSHNKKDNPQIYEELTSLGKQKAHDFPLVPSYQWGFIWSKSHSNLFLPSTATTETAEPLPFPPLSLLHNLKIQCTLDHLKSFILVDTLFNVDHLKNLLTSHSNQPFVKLVMKGLREGFWPFNKGEWKLKESKKLPNYSTEDKNLDVIWIFWNKKVELGHWSDVIPHHPTTLPGLKTSPMFVIWQHNKPQVITDHVGSGLNDGIPKDQACVQYDNMHTFSQVLHSAIQKNPDQKIITFKSNIAFAFLNLPVHPLWQIQQIVQVGDESYIVHCLVFGNRGSLHSWCSLSGLICWLALKKFDIVDLHVYMDDFFGWDFADNLLSFHGQLCPHHQIQLLLLWDGIICPYNDKK